MENPISPFEAIEQYLEDSLSLTDKTDFEQKLNGEPQWAEELNSYKTLTGGIRATQRRKMLLDLRTIDAEMPAYQPDNEPVGQPAKNKTLALGDWKKEILYWAGAAGILALLIPGYYYIQDQKTEKLFSQYFSPHQAASNVLAPSEEVMREYREGDYAQALSLLMNAEGNFQHDTLTLPTLFYKGNMYLATKKPDEAIACFERILQDPDPSDKYRQQSEWYLALSYLKDNKASKAKKLLEKITTDLQNPRHEEAKELLKKL